MSISHHAVSLVESSLPRHDWTREEVRALFELPFPELMFRAAQVHRDNFDPSEVQISTLLSIKTGGCPEDCAYCPQSAQIRHRRESREADGSRGRARRSARGQGRRRLALLHGRGLALAQGPRSRQGLRDGGGREGARLETCVTLGMLTRDQARAAEGLRSRLLQPQSRHLAGILRRDHHHAHLSGPARHARACARRRHPCLLRRHRRHGRGRWKTASA